eukprot:1147767-Rhodomonas_salina.1
MALRTRYAVSGTEAGNTATRRRCSAVPQRRMVYSSAKVASPYGPTARAVLSWGMLLPGSRRLASTPYGRMPTTVSPTHYLLRSLLRTRCAICYAHAAPCPVLRLRMRLPAFVDLDFANGDLLSRCLRL